jgi:XisH protein
MARDRFHYQVREALERDGWIITHDPYFIYLGKRKGFIDLGAEKALLAADRGAEKIAVEIKSFLGLSDIQQFEEALGQFLLYRPALTKKEPDRLLFLALPASVYHSLFDDSYFEEVAELYQLKLLIYNEKEKIIVQWKK